MTKCYPLSNHKLFFLSFHYLYIIFCLLPSMLCCFFFFISSWFYTVPNHFTQMTSTFLRMNRKIYSIIYVSHLCTLRIHSSSLILIHLFIFYFIICFKTVICVSIHLHYFASSFLFLLFLFFKTHWPNVCTITTLLRLFGHFVDSLALLAQPLVYLSSRAHRFITLL